MADKITKEVFDLTPTQAQILKPLFARVNEAAKRSTKGKDTRGSILAQIFEESELVHCYFLNHEQTLTAQRGHKRAFALTTPKTRPRKPKGKVHGR